MYWTFDQMSSFICVGELSVDLHPLKYIQRKLSTTCGCII